MKIIKLKKLGNKVECIAVKVAVQVINIQHPRNVRFSNNYL